ncbi:MAG: NlpC/P60 family protein [Solobacterium sp.]|jgi:cell wall-associated NlpC family hydrolase|nr:NlpC/P60 family protein [Solobacterium sp.]MCH4049712.1 NlpC/P60 family protein [Solobacterium sp.]MCH4073397.1 NlpC/P60 family protein [Solobacterium sp.]MCI1313056.1 NlpC/P60 family protein [Solobacterium sp.]MCI1345511.1 NlpC/P60 family protein [Solobacterium sp.]
MKYRKTLSIVTSLLITASLMPVHIQADEDYSDTDYWTKHCTDTSAALSDSCEAFYNYMSSQSASLAKKLKEIDAKKDEISADIDTYKTKIADYQTQIDDLSSQIADLESEISGLNSQITDLEANVADLQAKVETQISSSQSTMRLSKVIDVLMGAKSFEELIRIAKGLSDITQYSNNTMNELTQAENDLKNAKAQVEQDQADLSTKQEDVIAAQYEAQTIEQAYEEQAAQLSSDYSEVSLNMDYAGSVITSIDTAQAQAQAEAEEKARQEAEAKAAAEAAAAAAAQQQAQQNNTANNNNNAGAAVDPNAGTVDNNASAAVTTASRSALVAYAETFVGCPYVWGGTSPSGFDCSGFVQYVFAHFGISLPRTSYAQAGVGTGVSLAAAQPGDIIIWDGHAGIYIGNNQVVNALNPSYGVCICSIYMITNSNMRFRSVL